MTSHKKRRIVGADGTANPAQPRRPRIIHPLGDSRWMTHKEQSLYYRTVRESEGFDVLNLPGVMFFGMVFPVSRDEEVVKYTNDAISFNNSQEGTDLKLVKVVKANCCLTYPKHYYITFKAKDGEGRIRKYETKVSYIPGKPTGKIRVDIFRVKPPRSKPPSA